MFPTYALVAGDEVTHVVYRDGGQGRDVGADVDAEEAMALPFALELGCKLCSRHLVAYLLVGHEKFRNYKIKNKFKFSSNN